MTIEITQDDFRAARLAERGREGIAMPTHPLFKNLEGKTFSRWTVIAYAGKIGADHAFECVCVCGNSRRVRGATLTGGVSRSCGCLLADKNREIRETHGMSHKPEWRIWANMKKRCFNPNVHAFDRYGGRGITVCDRWVKGDGNFGGFQCFLADLGRRPSKDYSIERNDVHGPYSPENCRWATRHEQAINTQRTMFLTFKGKTQSVWAWQEETKISAPQIQKRIGRGWTVERTLSQRMRRSRVR